MATYVPPKRNVSFVFYVGLVSQTDGKILQVNPTLAAGDVKVAIDDGAPANLAPPPAVDADFTKRVKVSLSAAEMNGDQCTVLFADAAGAEWCDLMLNIQTVARQNDDLAFPVVSGRGVDVDATGGVEITSGQSVASVTGAVGSVTADVGITQGGADKVWLSTVRTITALGLSLALDVWHVLTASVVTPATMGALVKDNLNATVSSRSTQASVDAVDDFVDTEIADIQARLPAALVGGRMAANAEVVGDKTGYTLTVAEHASVADKLLGRTRAGGADGGRTVAQCLALGRNKWAISGTTLTVYADDGTTPLYTAEVTQAAGDPITSVTPA